LVSSISIFVMASVDSPDLSAELQPIAIKSMATRKVLINDENM